MNVTGFPLQQTEQQTFPLLHANSKSLRTHELLKFKNAIFKILCSTAPHAGIAVHNHPPGGRHISTEIWQRLSSLFPFSRAFSNSAFTVFPPFPLFRKFPQQKPLRRRESPGWLPTRADLSTRVNPSTNKLLVALTRQPGRPFHTSPTRGTLLKTRVGEV